MLIVVPSSFELIQEGDKISPAGLTGEGNISSFLMIICISLTDDGSTYTDAFTGTVLIQFITLTFEFCMVAITIYCFFLSRTFSQNKDDYNKLIEKIMNRSIHKYLAVLNEAITSLG